MSNEIAEKTRAWVESELNHAKEKAKSEVIQNTIGRINKIQHQYAKNK